MNQVLVAKVPLVGMLAVEVADIAEKLTGLDLETGG